METYTVEVTSTVEVEAENEDEAYEKAFKEFMDQGINPNSFYVYVNGKEY